MFFVVSKVAWAIVQPLSLIALLLFASALLALGNRRRLARTAFGLGLALLCLCAFTTFGTLLVAPLENRFARPAQMPDQVAAIIILGGGVDPTVTEARGATELSAAGDRFLEGLRLARLYPTAKILVTGGFGSLFPAGESDAEAAPGFYASMGIDPARLILESKSRNTEENATLTKELLGNDQGALLLVTSAFHMPRSVGLFRAAEVPVLPWPVDFRSTGHESFGVDLSIPSENLSTTSIAMREWIGLVAYWATGKIANIFPGPADRP
ncbi:YdcF family protein [Devosia sp.]|uniref:YdcF family protein n=1 Tax=Devosia sp. TaxID=1871048 RepID=UPI003265E041